MNGIYAMCVSIIVMREDYNYEKKRQESLGFPFKVSDAYWHFGYIKNQPNEVQFYYSHKEAINACQNIVEQTGVKPEEILVISNAIFCSLDITDMHSIYHYEITKSRQTTLNSRIMNKIIIAILAIFGIIAAVVGLCTKTYWNIMFGLMAWMLAYVLYKYD